jgi:NADH-quinone oxidoreductase subunit F
MPVQGALKHFRAEFEHHVTHKTCMVNRRRDAVAGVRG